VCLFRSVEGLIYLNGIDATTGEYLVPPFGVENAASMARGGDAGGAPIPRWMRGVARRVTERHFGLPLGVDPAKPEQAGWAIVFHADEAQEVRAALEPLVEHRRAQIGDRRTKVLTYERGQDTHAWLAQYGVAHGSVEPEKVPYYLLFVGSPTLIPYDLQYLLDVEYAVGRVSFDSPADYERYARSVLQYETSSAPPDRNGAAFFGTRHASDPATELSADSLVEPLADELDAAGTPVRMALGPDATKAQLSELLADPPAVLFTATHGIGFPKGDAVQLRHQGALLCQDWPGKGKLGPQHYFSADDVPGDAPLHGLLSFHFACYSAGTPQRDAFLHQRGKKPREIAERPFVAALPRQLLAAGALAVIGHVERAWGCSFDHPEAGVQLLPFRNAVAALIGGLPVGYACKDLNERYAVLSTALLMKLEDPGFGVRTPDREIASAWIERNDAQSYVVVGDPAARLRSA